MRLDKVHGNTTLRGNESSGNIWPFSYRSLQWKALAAAPLPTRVWIPFKRGLSCTMGPNVGKFWH